MTETGVQLLAHVAPVCQWLPPNSPNPNTTIPAYPRFPVNARDWAGFQQAVVNQTPPPGGQQFPVFQSIVRPLRIEAHATTRFRDNVLLPVGTLLLQTQGADFDEDSHGLLGSSDFVLRDNNQVAKMPVEMKTRHNLDLRGYNFSQIFRSADPRNIGDLNFKFKKRILSQIFGEMACNGLHYGILSNYSDTYFFMRQEEDPNTLFVSGVIRPDDTNPTLRECVYCISQLAINDVVGIRLGRILRDNDSSNDDNDSDDSNHDDPDDPNDPDYAESPNDHSSDDYDDANYSRKRKRRQSSVKTGRSVSSSKGITTIGEYISGGTFGQVFSGYYDNQAVAWKTCDTYKKQEEMKTLKHEAHIYSVLKECQGTKKFFFIHNILILDIIKLSIAILVLGRIIPRLFYKGYIYDGYLFALALQLVENAHHIDPTILTKEEKKLIVNQLKSIHNFGVLHNDISLENILYEPKSHQFFLIDFGLSEIVDNESSKLRKEERRLKKLLQL
jgi:hypothetical protein